MRREAKSGETAEFAQRGSQRWLQVAINCCPDVLFEALKGPLGLGADDCVEWRSPLRMDGFKEYRDGEALLQTGITKLRLRPLSEFWPARGPVWDAIGTAGKQPVFVEAKAHIAEMASPGTKASPDSRRLIEDSLEQTRRFYAPKSTAPWTETFYQYTNRLAHHYLLRELNQIESHLVFLYFLNAEDVNGPTCQEKWEGAIELMRAALGLSQAKPEGVHTVFDDVRELEA
jgi:hypothetical protein